MRVLEITGLVVLALVALAVLVNVKDLMRYVRISIM
jgi:hypothetical protein